MTPLTERTRSRRRSPGCLIAIAVLVGLLGKAAWDGLADYRDRHRTTASVRLADGAMVRLSFADESPHHMPILHPSGGEGCVFHWLSIHGDGPTMRYLVAWNIARPPGIEVRANPTQQHLWLVCGGEVIASLDRSTGRFINRGGWLVDSSWDTATQKNDYAMGGRSAGLPQPDWATPTVGVLLATTDSYTHQLDAERCDAGLSPFAVQMPEKEGGFAFGYGG